MPRNKNRKRSNRSLSPEVCIYQRGESYHVRDKFGVQYVVNSNLSSGRPIKRFRGNFYNRIDWCNNYRDSTPGQAALQDSFDNFSGGYSHIQEISVTYKYIPKRTHTQVMNAVMENLFGQKYSATEYYLFLTFGIQQPSLLNYLQPRYEWCHLASHGLGGRDEPDNIVAATSHCNSEQLIIENAIYQYRNEENSFRIRVRASLDDDRGFKQYLGKVIKYEILAQKYRQDNSYDSYYNENKESEKQKYEVIFTYFLDCKRSRKPNRRLVDKLTSEVCSAMNCALGRIHPVKDRDPNDVINFLNEDS